MCVRVRVCGVGRVRSLTFLSLLESYIDFDISFVKELDFSFLSSSWTDAHVMKDGLYMSR